MVEVQTSRVICDTFGITRPSQLNPLLIDAEGSDWEILQSFPVEQILPNLIIAEHAHLPREQRRQMIDLLMENKYRIKILDRDIIAERDIESEKA